MTITEIAPTPNRTHAPTEPIPRAAPRPAPEAAHAPEELIIPHPEYYRNGQLQIVIAGLDQNVRDYALEAAHSSLESQLAGRGLRGIVAGVVKGHLFRNHYLLKEAARAKQSIVKNNNLMHFHGTSAHCYSEPTLRRLTQGNDAYIEHDAGEAREHISAYDREPEKQAYRRLAMGVIKDYVHGDPSIQHPVQFARKVRALLREHQGSKKFREYFGDGSVHIDNLWQAAQNVSTIARMWDPQTRDAYLHTLLNNANVTIGRVRIGPRSSFATNRVERFLQKIEGKTFLNEAAVVSGVTLAAAVGGLAVQRTLGAMTAAIAPGAVAGMWAARREKHMLNDERVKHLRDRALGKDTPMNGRREFVSASDYEMVRSVDVTAKLRQFYNERNQRLYIENDAKLRDAFKLLTRAETYFELSNKHGIDLLVGTCAANYQIERDILKYNLEQFKMSLRMWLRDADPEALKRDFGLQKTDIQQLKNFSPDAFQKLKEVALMQRTDIEQDVAQKDREFRGRRRRRAMRVAGAVALVGATLGLGAQEGFAQLSDKYEGVFERGTGGQRQTWLAGLLHKDTPVSVSQASQNVSLMGGPTLQVPTSFSVDPTGEAFNLAGPDSKLLENLTYTANGELTPDSIARLEAAGLQVTATSSQAETAETVTRTMTAGEFIAANPKATSTSAVDFFYTNNTRPSDGLETRLQYGGNYGVDKNGNYVITLGDLNGKTATHGNHALNVEQAAKDGKIWLAVSGSKDTNAHKFMVKMNANGQFIIPKDGDVGQLLKPGKNGRYPIFQGFHMQAFEHGGTNAKGEVLMRPLATEIGTNKASFTTTSEVTKSAGTTSYAISYTAPASPSLVAVPPILPLLISRRTLSTTKAAPEEIESAQRPAEPTAQPNASTAPTAAHGPRHAAEPQLPTGAKPIATNIAQGIYKRLLDAKVPIEEAKDRLCKALRQKANLSRDDIQFSSDGTHVYIMTDARIPRHLLA